MKQARPARARRVPKRPFFAALLPALCLALPCGAAKAEGAPSFVAHYTTASLSAQELSAENLLNSDRARYALPALDIDPELCRLARLKSEDMRDNGYFAHVSPTYGDVRRMLTDFGYPYAGAGENIAHHATVEKCEAAFLSSPGHRRNILNRSYTKAGVGVAFDAKGFVYLTQIFCR